MRKPSGPRRIRPTVELLEPRQLLSGYQPTAQEQLFLEELNDARANPAAYGASIGVDLSGVAPAQPLAFNTQLIQGARDHSQDMNDQAYFGHNSLTGLNPGQRITNAGFTWTAWAESIAAGYPTPDQALQGLITDTGVPDLGHRRQLLAIGSMFLLQNQVGVGIVLGGSGPYSDYYTIDTAAGTNTQPFITGVVFNDVNGNGKYDVGEGLGGVVVTVAGVGSTTTFGSGGYSLQVAPGTYRVTISGGSLSSPMTQVITVGVSNFRLNFNALTAPKPPAVHVSLADPGFQGPFQGSGFWSFTFNPAGSAWTFLTNAGLTGNYSAFTNGNPMTPQSVQAAFLQDNGSICQTTTLAAGTYVLNVNAAQRGNGNHGGQQIQALVDGQPVGLILPGSINFATYATGPFTVTAGSHTIMLHGLDLLGGDNTAFIDQVSLGPAPVLSDPTFQTPAQGSGFYAFTPDPLGSPWFFTGTAGLSGNVSAFTSGNPDAPQGIQVAYLQQLGAISQAVMVSAGTYVVSLAAAQRGNQNHGVQNFQVLIDSQVLGTFTPTGSAYATYTTIPITLTAGRHVLTLAGVDSSGGDNTAFINQVSLTPSSLLADAGFEQAPQGSGFGAYTLNPGGSPWSFSGTSGLTGNDSAYTSGNPNAPQVNQVAFLQGTGSISQTTGSLSAGTYVVSLMAAQRGNLFAGGQTIEVLVDGQAIASFTPPGATYTTFVTTSFMLGAGPHIIQLRGLNLPGGDNTAFIDQVFLNQLF
jgi:uncharacterized protein YkwD